MGRHSGLILFTGAQGEVDPASLFEALSPFAIQINAVEEITIKNRLILTVHISLDKAHAAAIESDLSELAKKNSSDIAVIFEDGANVEMNSSPLHVALIAQTMVPQNLFDLTSLVSNVGGAVTKIRSLPCEEFTALIFDVAGVDPSVLNEKVRELSRATTVDAFVLPPIAHRVQRSLLVMDVDSTLIDQEVIELLGAKAGKGAEIKAITDRAMAGELDFEGSLRERVALLAGLPASVIDEVRSEITLTPGAKELIETTQRAGFAVGLVSGGFTSVIAPLAETLGISHLRANSLEIEDGRLTGKIEGPVIDRSAKEKALRDYAQMEGIDLANTFMIGDGANDLDAMSAAGIGISFVAKPIVKASADASISFRRLDAALVYMGLIH